MSKIQNTIQNSEFIKFFCDNVFKISIFLSVGAGIAISTKMISTARATDQISKNLKYCSSFLEVLLLKFVRIFLSSSQILIEILFSKASVKFLGIFPNSLIFSRISSKIFPSYSFSLNVSAFKLSHNFSRYLFLNFSLIFLFFLIFPFKKFLNFNFTRIFLLLFINSFKFKFLKSFQISFKSWKNFSQDKLFHFSKSILKISLKLFFQSF